MLILIQTLLKLTLYILDIIGALALVSLLGYEAIAEGDFKEIIDNNSEIAIGIAGGWILNTLDDFKSKAK